VWVWVAQHLVVPDGPHAGTPLELNSVQTEVLYRWYGLDEDGMFRYRRGCWRAAQGTGKSPFMAAVALAELCGPTRFAGWDAKGKPIASEPVAPWVQLAACSEDQSQNTYRAARAMAEDSDLNGSLLDVGITRITRRDGPGILESVTASASTRFGQRVSFAVLDESHLWTKRNGGVRLADVIRRSASKMGGRTFECTNAFAIGEGSVAELTHAAALENDEILYVAVEAPHVDDLSDFPAVYSALEAAYGPAARSAGGWVDLNRVARDIADPSMNPDDACRYHFNQVRAESSPFDLAGWSTLTTNRTVRDGERIGIGFDGSISQDETVLYGCTQDGYLFLIAAWSRPERASKDWRVPRHEVHAAVAAAFDRYDVGRMYADPPKWYSEIEDWQRLYGDRVLALETNFASRFAPLCDLFATAIAEGALTHDGDELLTQALAACARKNVRLRDDPDDGRTRFVIVKADTRKIDRAVGAVLAYGASMTMPEHEPTTSTTPWAFWA
jgi:hypothetical protein